MRLAEALKAAMLQADNTGTIRQTIEKLEADTSIEIDRMRARGQSAEQRVSEVKAGGSIKIGPMDADAGKPGNT